MGCLTTQVEKGPIIASWVAQLEVNFTSLAQLAICICKFHLFDWINGRIKNGEINEQKIVSWVIFLLGLPDNPGENGAELAIVAS